MSGQNGTVISISGPLVQARLSDAVMGSQVMVGPDRVVGEVIRLKNNVATFQMYEPTELIRPGDAIEASGELLSVELGPGLLGQVFDGLQRPLDLIRKRLGDRIHRGVTPPSLDRTRLWPFVPSVVRGKEVHGGQRLGSVQETPLLKHHVLVPPGIRGELIEIAEAGQYTIETVIARVQFGSRQCDLRLFHHWPVRTERPITERFVPHLPLITGQRVLDILFPVAKGGTAAVPGPFGAGKTIVQHQLARWCDAQVIVYVGCGERGNEMVDLLEQFRELTDPHTGRPLLERSVLIANTSNMPVTAREASIYTGITIAEYFRDQGYHVALMADSTSRWAEALREVAGRLEELPAEEGYPAYLGSRLAAFYERAGHGRVLNGDEGSVTVIGSVSPPGGDFSEPTTRHTQSIVGTFWALSKPLADARHYPALDWDESFSLYADRVSDWWRRQFKQQWTAARDTILRLLHDTAQQSRFMEHWSSVPTTTLSLLREADELKQIAAIIGPTALSERQQWTFHAAGLIREGFLQQNALDPIDSYCSPEKQILLAALILGIYQRGRTLVETGVPSRDLLALPSIARLKRARQEIPNDRPDLLHQLGDQINAEFARLANATTATSVKA